MSGLGVALRQFGSKIYCLNRDIVLCGQEADVYMGTERSLGPHCGRWDLVSQSLLHLTFLLGQVSDLRKPLSPPPGLLTGPWGALLLHPPIPESTFLGLAAPGRPSNGPSACACSACSVRLPSQETEQGPSTKGFHFHSRCGRQLGQPKLPRKSGGQIGWQALLGVPGPLSVIFLLDTTAPPP